MRPFGIFCKALGKRWWALMSCAVFTFLSVYVAATNKSSGWFVVATSIAAVAMFVIAAYSAWKEQFDRASEENRPKFVLDGGPIVANYENEHTLVFLGLRIKNAGAPSAVLGWNAYYSSPTRSDQMKIVVMKNEILKLTMPSGKVFVFRSADAINRRADSPIPRGGFIAGRLPCVIDGNKISDITNGVARITVTVTDYLGAKSSFEFKGTGEQTHPMYITGEPLALSELSPMFEGNSSKQKPPLSKRKRKRR